MSAQGQDTDARSSMSAAAASGSAWTTTQMVVNKLVTVFAMLLLARFLSPAEFGLANLAASIGAFVFVFAPFVMGDVLLSRPDRFNAIAGAANAVAWGAGIVLFGILAAAAIPIERISGKEGLALLVFIAALRPLADAVLVVPNSRMRIDLAYRRIAIIDGGVILASTVAGVVMAWLGAGPMAITLPPIAVLAVRGMFYWRAVNGRVPLGVKREQVPSVARSFAMAALGQYLNNVLLILEVLVLGWYATETEIGLFGLAFQLAIQANMVIASQLGAVLQPIFGHIQNDPDRQVGGFVRATRLLSSVAVPISLVQAALAVPAFTMLFEPKWTGSIAIFAVLSIGQAFMFVSAPSIALLKAQGRFRAYFAWQFAQLVTALVAFVLAVTQGAPIASELAMAVGLPVDPESGRALALGMASALVWATFCPIAVWLAGRPAQLGIGRTLSVFIEPWAVTLPAAAALVLLWSLLRASIGQWTADLAAIAVLGPLAVLVSIAGCVWLRADTRADCRTMLSKFIRRRKA
jgi:teichuronic acid exporter